MLRNLNLSSGGKRILGVPEVGILAEQIASETATGDNGPGILYNESQQPEYAGKYLRARVLNFPDTGTLFVHENGSYEVDGLPDDLHEFEYELYVDGDLQSGTATFSFAVGTVDATASGATLTGTASLSAGSASGETSGTDGTAPGSTLTGTAELIPGSVLFSQEELDYLLSYLQENFVIPTAEQIAEAVWSHASGYFIERINRNKFITDPVTGVATLYDDDGVTPLVQGQLYEDADGTQTYRGRGAERRERLT